MNSTLRKVRFSYKRMRKRRNPFIVRTIKTHEDRLHLTKRHKKEARFQIYGVLAVVISLCFLAMLLFTIIANGYTSFVRTEIYLPVHLDAKAIDKGSYRKLISRSLEDFFREVSGRQEKRELRGLLSKMNERKLQRYIEEKPEKIGKTENIWLVASSEVDMLMKGHISVETDESLRRVSNQQVAWIYRLKEEDRIRKVFNSTFFSSGDSREPEQAGILGGFVGSIFTIFICMLVSLPLGVGAAVYLEEFAPKNKITDLIEININNLAAVPSIIFGLLALAIYLNVFGLPRSSALVGGLALSMLVLPTIVITTRNALQAVPPSMRQAAMGLGATKLQMVWHHIVPYALPGIMTGTILSIARALGETAPLLMIGMVAFVADVPRSLTDPATSLPVQVYLWADSPEMGFIEKTSACIIILLVLLSLLNAAAVYLRKKFEYDW